MKAFLLAASLFFVAGISDAQNVGIGTTTPESKLHVNGDLKLQNGFSVSKFSRDSLFTENSHNNVPTEKAIKDYLQKGIWGIAADSNAIGSQAPLARGFVSHFTISGPAAVAKQGSYAFVASYSNDKLVCVNVNNPDSIYYRSEISTNLDGPVDMHVQGNYAYVVSELNDRLSIYDISNPAFIVAKGFTSTNIRRPTSVFVQGNYAYVTSDLFNNLSIFDISNPDAIVAKGFTSTNMSLPVDVVVSGNYAYLVSAGNSRLCIYDIGNPDAIVAKGFTNSGLNGPVSVYVQGNYAYVLTRDPSSFSSFIRIYNVSNPDVIAAAGNNNLGLNGPNKLHMAGNALYVVAGGILRLFDAANPVSLKFVGETNTNLNGPTGVFASGDFAYVTSYNNNRLCVFDLNRSNPVQVTPAGLQVVPLQWQTYQNNIYRSNGNVGIGNSNPQSRLDITGRMRVDQSTTGGYGGLIVKGNAPGSNYPNIGFAVNSGSGVPDYEVAALIQGDINNNASGSENMDLTFYTSETGIFGLGERMRIKSSGNIGIGTASPASKLSVAGNADISGNLGLGNSAPSNRLSVTGNANITGNLGIGNASPTRPLSFPAALGEKILLYPGGAGEVGIGVYGNELRLHCDNPGSKVSFGTQDNAGVFTEAAKAQINGAYAFSIFGSLWVNGTTYASDERFKQNITPIISPLEKLVQIKGVEYEMRTKEFSANRFQEGRQIGLLAQNVEKVVPEAVSEQDGYKGVDYAKLVPLLIESVKELREQVVQQQRQIDDLNNQLKRKD